MRFETIHYALIVAFLVAPFTLLQWRWHRQDARAQASDPEASRAADARAAQTIGTGFAATEIGYLASAFMWFEAIAWAWIAAALAGAWITARTVPRLGLSGVCLTGIVSWPVLLMVAWAFPETMSALGFL